MGAKSAKQSLSTALVPVESEKRKGRLRMQIIEGNEQDFYELFMIEHYTEWSDDFKKDVEKSFRLLARMYHPDKNPGAEDECDAIMKSLNFAKETLIDPEKKSQYDRQLRDDRKDYTKWDTFRWASKWGINLGLILGGTTALVAGILGAVPSGGATLALTAAGAGGVAAGVRGAQKAKKDPHGPVKDWVGSVVGAGARGAVMCAGGQFDLPSKQHREVRDQTPNRGAQEELALARERRDLKINCVSDVVGKWRDKSDRTIEIQLLPEHSVKIIHSRYGESNLTVDEFYADGKYHYEGCKGDLSPDLYGETIVWSNGNKWRKESSVHLLAPELMLSPATRCSTPSKPHRPDRTPPPETPPRFRPRARPASAPGLRPAAARPICKDVGGKWRDNSEHTIEIQLLPGHSVKIIHSRYGESNLAVDTFYADGKYHYAGCKGDLSGDTITWTSGNKWRKEPSSLLLAPEPMPGPICTYCCREMLWETSDFLGWSCANVAHCGGGSIKYGSGSKRYHCKTCHYDLCHSGCKPPKAASSSSSRSSSLSSALSRR